mmetsp:Transcript_67457/g.158242  ORF Transcript_67457/g.158242 Transcript_67457/m.158242 type:complete len:529 (-) Transcript_67457:21-1607(-)
MIEYSENWLILTIFRRKGSVAPRACWFAIPTGVVAFFLAFADEWVGPDFRRDFGLLEAQQSQLWQAATGVLFALLIFRINRAMARFWEGTGLLHQMRGEWFDSVSCCVTFSRAGMKDKADATLAFRHTIVRLMSLCHGTALKEIGGEDATDCVTIDPAGLDTGTLLHLQACTDSYGFNRVEVLLHLIQSLITQSLDDGIIRVPAPIISRVYQTLSRGFVNLLNAKKIADTRFPFPFAQLISLLLFVNIVLTPILITSIFTQPVWCVVFSVIPIFGMSCLNFIGVELENPFGQDDNDLPLDHFQGEMNNCLLMLLHSSADLLPDVDITRCLTDVVEIRDVMSGMEVRKQASERPEMIHVPSSAKAGRKTLATSSTVESLDLIAPIEASTTIQTIQATIQESALLNALPPPGTELKVRAPFQDERNFEKSEEKPKGEDKLKTEEQLQTEAMLRGMERMVANLQSIKSAVEEQANKVSESTKAMTEFCTHLDSVLLSGKKAGLGGERVTRSGPAPVRRRAGSWECSLMKCM